MISIMINDTINKKILKALKDMNCFPLNSIQEDTFFNISNNENVLLQSPTGSGKTIAYLLPLLNNIDENSNNTQYLIIAPTRELVLQISKVAKQICAYTKINIITLVGGLDSSKQINALKHHPHVLIGTCGRLLDLYNQNMIYFDKLKSIVFDEVDLLITSAQLQDIENLLKHLPNIQQIFISATGKEIIKSIIPNEIKEINYSKESNIRNYHFICSNKQIGLIYLLKHLPITSGIVFVKMKSETQKIVELLRKENILAEAFSSHHSETKRITIIDQFKKGKIRILVATDAASRGLDIQDVSHVINYDYPDNVESFIHRSGRSGHQGQNGISITLLDEQSSFESLCFLKDTKPLFVDNANNNDLSQPLFKNLSSRISTKTFIIRSGKKDKIRPKDIIGALCAIIDYNEIGKVEIQDCYSLVDIFHPSLIKIDHLIIKGKKRKIEIFNKDEH